MQQAPNLGFLKNVTIYIDNANRKITIQPADDIPVPLSTRLYFNHWTRVPNPSNWTIVLENWRIVDESDAQCVQMLTLVGFRVEIGSTPENMCDGNVLASVKKQLKGRIPAPGNHFAVNGQS